MLLYWKKLKQTNGKYYFFYRYIVHRLQYIQSAEKKMYFLQKILCHQKILGITFLPLSSVIPDTDLDMEAEVHKDCD